MLIFTEIYSGLQGTPVLVETKSLSLFCTKATTRLFYR